MELIIFIIIIAIAVSNSKKGNDKREKRGSTIWDQVDKGGSEFLKTFVGKETREQLNRGLRDLEDVINNAKRKGVQHAKRKEEASYQQEQETWRKKQEEERKKRDALEQRKRILEERQKQQKEQERRQKLELQKKQEEERKKQAEKDQAFHEEELHKKICVNEGEAYAFKLDDYLSPTTASFYPKVDDYLSPTTASFYPDADITSFSLQNETNMI
jgi:hypothetical protein